VGASYSKQRAVAGDSEEFLVHTSPVEATPQGNRLAFFVCLIRVPAAASTRSSSTALCSGDWRKVRRNRPRSLC